MSEVNCRDTYLKGKDIRQRKLLS